MRFHFMLVPAALVANAPAHAEIYLDIKQAQELLFPGAAFTEDFRALNDAQIETIIADTNVTVWNRSFKIWRVSTGDWFVIDQVLGRDDWITYAVAIRKDGVVLGIEVLECLERWNQVTWAEWRNQFNGRRYNKQPAEAGIELISGTTLSSVHIAEGVKRVLSTFTHFIAPNAG